MSLVDRDRKHLWHPYTQEKTAPLPLPITGAKGVWLETEDGRRLLDGVSSWWVNTHGHSHPYINKALSEQAGTLEHVIFAGFTHEPAIRLSEMLVEVLPEGLNRIFFSDNGSTAVEVALKMAYQYWVNKGEERTTFLALERGYHGDTIGAMSASDASTFTDPFKSLLFTVKKAAAPFALECGHCSDRCDVTCSKSLEDLLRHERGNVAAVIVEPMLQGAGGMIVWKAAYLKRLRELCDEYGVLLIADEVLTGFGRTGTMFACEHAEISPDILCMSKALTAGYMPLGATAATDNVFEAFYHEDRLKTFFHGHSYCANPLACAVAIANLELFEKENTLSKIAFINSKFKGFENELSRFESVRDVRIIGGVLAFEIEVRDGGYLADIGQQFYQRFLEKKIVLRPLGNVLLFMPPYVIKEEEIDWVLDEIRSVLSAYEATRVNSAKSI
ncbi:MAG: adenosylmethionine--8-amino-7-oxononanoate transaminase [Pyrinomonadaceae bacterium]|nr:adenosylmethionine--8-amino-7-oxononanoate transaminase [Pyrinomonadaceae bacterium]